MPPLKPDRDKNFGGSLVVDFGLLSHYYSHIRAIFSAMNGRDSGHKKAKNHANKRDIFMATTYVSSL